MLELTRRHCEERSDEAIHSSFAAPWIASRSLSSGAHSRDPLARNDEGIVGWAKACLRRAHHLSAHTAAWWARFALPTLRTASRPRPLLQHLDHQLHRHQHRIVA